jgi:hypothetical protein
MAAARRTRSHAASAAALTSVGTLTLKVTTTLPAWMDWMLTSVAAVCQGRPHQGTRPDRG